MSFYIPHSHFTTWNASLVVCLQSCAIACTFVQNKAFIIVLQETHCTTADKLVIPNFSLAGSVLSRNYGRGTFVHERLEWSLVVQSPELSDTEWLCVDVAGYRSLTSTNLHAHDSHQRPSRRSNTPVCMLVTSTVNMSTDVTPTCQLGYTLTVKAWTPGQHPTTFVCYITQRKQPASSHRWNVGTNPDLAFASFGRDSWLPDRRVLGKFPMSQYRPSLITPPKLKVPAHSDPVRHWNFRKADWRHFSLLTDESVERLPPLDTLNIERAYQDFCESLLSAARQCIPRGCYVPYWDKECKTLYRSFTWAQEGTDSDRDASYLELNRSRSDGRKQQIPSTSHILAARCGEPINELTGRSGRSFQQCPISANSIAAQLVKNGAHKTGDHKPTRLVNKELSDLWKTPTPRGGLKAMQLHWARCHGVQVDCSYFQIPLAFEYSEETVYKSPC